MKIATCTIVRLENNYLIEFVEHYKSIGVDHMFIYDNNIPNTENVTDVLQKYINDKFVTVINFQDQKEYPMGDAIIKAFTDCWENNKDVYDWILFLDNDEFLTLVKDNNIKEYLGRDCFKDKDIIRVNWLCYDDNNLIYYEDKPLKERFTHPCNDDPYSFEENYHIKSIIHNTAPDIKFIPGNAAHCPLLTYTIKYCNNKGDALILDKKNKINNHKNYNINYDLAYYAHYRMKTIDEYINNKIKKLTLQGYKNIDFTLNMFFKYNEYSKEKERIYLDYIKNNSKNVIYTILEENDEELKDPNVISNNFDYVCFSANHNIKSNIWKINYIDSNKLIYKEIKFLPHRYLNNYNFCVYIDKSISINVDFNIIKNKFIDIPNSYTNYFWVINNEYPTNIMCRYLLDQSCIRFELELFKYIKNNKNINDDEVFNKLTTLNNSISKINKYLFLFTNDNKYKTYLKNIYKFIFKRFWGVDFDYNNPIGFNQTLASLNIKYDYLSKLCKYVDKITVDDYVKECGYESLLIKKYKTYNNCIEFINDLENLPNDFVVKCNHDSGSTYKIKNKKINSEDYEKLILNMNKIYGINNGETQYFNIKPKLLTEELIDCENVVDYKFYCFNGEVKMCTVVYDYIKSVYSRRTSGLLYRFNMYDVNGNLLNEKYLKNYLKKTSNGVNYGGYNKNFILSKRYNEMINIASKLSEPFVFVRVDFMEYNDKIYFGELTFTPMGFHPYYWTDEYEKILGSYINDNIIINK